MIKKINGYYYATDKRGNTEKFASYQEAVEWLEMRGWFNSAFFIFI